MKELNLFGAFCMLCLFIGIARLTLPGLMKVIAALVFGAVEITHYLLSRKLK
jgi:hypothetical protein